MVTWEPATGRIRASRWQARWDEQPLREANYGYDPDELLSADQMGSRYTRRLTSDGNRDLDSLTHTRALEIAAYLYDTNPIAKRVCELTRDFVLGDTVEVSVKDDEAATEVVQKFWADPINQLDMRLYQRTLELGLYGEQCWTVSVNPVSGHVQIGYIDPARIKTITPDPNSPEDPYDVILEGDDVALERRYAVVAQDIDPRSSAYGRLIPPNRGVGQCFMWRVNSMTMATRGRSDLLSLADWIDAYDQLLFSELDRALLMKSFLWDVTLQGADERTINNYIKANPSPKPGSYRVHNERVSYSAVAPNLNMSDTAVGADLILAYISAGAGLPKTWLAGSMDVNRATAIELSDPAIKRLVSRQRFVKQMIIRVLTFVLDQAELHGILPRRIAQTNTLPQPWALSVTMPDIRGRDLAVAANTLQQVASAVSLALQDNTVDRETAVRTVTLAVQQLGVDVDADTVLKRTEEEREEKQDAAAQIAGKMFQGQGEEDPEEDPANPQSKQPVADDEEDKPTAEAG